RSAPYLISAIALRLGVIESMDPNWRTDRLFDKELYNSDLNNPDLTKRIPGHANGLETMFDKVTGAVQCGSKGNTNGCSGFPATCGGQKSTYVACADVTTGLSFESTLTGKEYDTPGGITHTQQVFKSQLIEQNPLFEMRSTIDKLHFYVSHAPDLAESIQRI